MDIRVLRYFLAVAREESITKAAEHLHMSQPPLSRQLKDLENELGVQLLIRGSRKVTLTEHGMILRKRAEELVELFHKTEKEVTSPGEAISGDVYIGSGETDAICMIAGIATKLREKYPGIHYHISSGDAEEVTERLDKGLIDFGILLDPVNVDKYNSIKIPAEDVFGVLMRRDSPLADKEHIRGEDLWDKPLIVSRQSLTSREMEQIIGREFSALDVVSTYTLIFNASRLVAEGFGYALCLDKLINTNGSNLCFKPLYPTHKIGMSLVWKKYQVFSRASTLFLNSLRDEWDKDI
ncbi:MAG: LysR family transcriptional regulator [Clostridia bacterium]|nr:LysR family transcriptional regulator [Clostridia bacterium]